MRASPQRRASGGRYQARMQREQSADAATSDAGRPQNTWAESVRWDRTRGLVFSCESFIIVR